MAGTNLWAKFRKLLPGDTMLVVEIAAINVSAGTSSVTTPAGGSMVVHGTSVSIGSKAYVKGGVIVGPAPSLTHYEIEV